MLNSRGQSYVQLNFRANLSNKRYIYERKRWPNFTQKGGQKSRWHQIDHLPSTMCGRDGPTPSRSQNYSGWSRVTDNRRWGASLISFSPKMTADGHVTIALAMKADTDELHTIFLLKKNARHDIIKTILGYPSIVIPETLKEWKVVITSVEQRYKSTEE